jgi:hypothetical protein
MVYLQSRRNATRPSETNPPPTAVCLPPKHVTHTQEFFSSELFSVRTVAAVMRSVRVFSLRSLNFEDQRLNASSSFKIPAAINGEEVYLTM